MSVFCHRKSSCMFGNSAQNNQNCGEKNWWSLSVQRQSQCNLKEISMSSRPISFYPVLRHHQFSTTFVIKHIFSDLWHCKSWQIVDAARTVRKRSRSQHWRGKSKVKEKTAPGAYHHICVHCILLSVVCHAALHILSLKFCSCAASVFFVA